MDGLATSLARCEKEVERLRAELNRRGPRGDMDNWEER